MSMFNDISCGSKDNKKECESNAQLVSLHAKRFPAGQWSFLGPGSEKKWYSISEDSPQGEWDKIAELMMFKIRRKRTPSLPSHESIVQRSAQKHRWWKIINTLHDRTVRPVVRGQSSPSFAPSVIKTNIPFNDDPAHEEFLLQRYRERIEKLSQDRLSKFCTDAGFLTTVEVGQYFMTKDTEEFSQFTDSVACREYTWPRDEDSSEPKGWIRGNTKIGPVLEVTTCCLHGKYGVEIRIKSVNKEFSLMGRNSSWLDRLWLE